MVRQGKSNRQQAVDERYNATIARAIFTILHAKEIETKETQTEWVANLPNIIKEINDRVKRNAKRRKEKFDKMDKALRCESDLAIF